MKKLILILLLLGGAGYAYWPYHATSQFRNALNEPDAKALESMVDWPAVRDSVKVQMQTALENYVKSKNRGVLQPGQAAVIKLVVEKAVAEKFTAEELATSAKKRYGKPDLEKVELTSREWVSATEFRATTNFSSGSLTFLLQGTGGWKLANIQFGPDDLDMNALVSVPPPAGAAHSANAPSTPQIEVQPLIPNAKKKEQWIFKDYKNPLDQKPK